MNRTERILSIYHLFKFCDEVSMQEISQQLSGCKKTFLRDIALLKKCKIPIHYSASRKAFVIGKINKSIPDATSQREAVFIKRLCRLIKIMDTAPEVDTDKWYSDVFASASKRTMQRDFAILTSIGYSVRYERSLDNMHDAGIDVTPRHYYCDRPHGAYELITFKG